MMPITSGARALASALCLALVGACGAPDQAPPDAAAPAAVSAPGPVATAPAEPDEQDDMLLADFDLQRVQVEEAFLTAAMPEHNVDSVALWRGPDGSSWLYATAKSSGVLLVHDGDSGLLKGTAGSPGDGPGQYARPNGLFVIDDFLLVVERDNRRVQVLHLPDLRPLGSFGADVLRKPYGIWVRSVADGYEAIVSDAYMSATDDDVVPAPALLGDRFQRFWFDLREDVFVAESRGGFGATDPAGAIRIPESLWGDEVHDRLLLAEEDQADGTRIKVYDLGGSFVGRDVGVGLFRAQAEGIALWACGDGSGYWVASDQFKDLTLFHVFDRQSLLHRGSFTGRTTANTDGIWLQQGPTTAFPAGVLYAVHDDQAVAAFDWRAIATALGLRADCVNPD